MIYINGVINSNSIKQTTNFLSPLICTNTNPAVKKGGEQVLPVLSYFCHKGAGHPF